MIGHNLGFGHSGKDVLYQEWWKNEVADPTCLMGYPKTGLSDSGLSMCFNAAKMWHSTWYEYEQITVRPKQESFVGNLVGIDDIVNNNNIRSDRYAAIRISGPFEPDFFLMYQRGKGINAGIPEDGNKVVITEQESCDSDSWWLDALGEGDSFVFEDWDWRNNSLVVKVCSIKTGSYDIASVIIYLEGQTDVTCPTDSITPTQAPLSTPYPSSPVTPSPSPSMLTPNPISPTSSPTVKFPPTISPTTSPTSRPTKTTFENRYDRFLLVYKEKNNKLIVKTKTCFWLSTKTNKRRKAICANKKYQVYSEELNYSPASLVCPVTCNDHCVREFLFVKFVFNEYINRSCKWLQKQSTAMIAKVCGRTINRDSVYGQAYQVCTKTCNSCSRR